MSRQHKRVHVSKTGVLAIGIAALAGIHSAHAARLYVNASSNSGSPDGSSWAKAFSNLQDALDQAASTSGPDEIWVAKGVYTPGKIYTVGGYSGGAYGRDNPGASDLPNLRTFNLPNQVAVLGGFAGNETTADKRNPAKNLTVLDGGGSVYHVVTAGDDVAQAGVTATIDGVTISGGNATGAAGGGFFSPFAYQHNYGGGLYIAFGSTITVQNVQFTNNRTAFFTDANAGDGAGLFANSSTVSITNSYFGHNISGLRGGALEILNTFEGNTPHTSTISTTIFDSNSTGLFGGAIVGEGTLPNAQSKMVIDRSLFVGNEAIEGGAIVFDSLTTNITNTVFQANHAFVNGGGLSTTNVVDTIVYTVFGLPPDQRPFYATTIANCEFDGNVADGNQTIHDTEMFGGPDLSGIDFALGGGAIVTYMNGYTNVSNSTFNNNQALNGDGGAILNGRSANAGGFGAFAYDVQTTVSNSTFSGNSAPAGNGGAIASLRDPRTNFQIAARENTRLVVNNSTFQKNSAGLNGGGLYFNYSTANFAKNSFTANTAGGSPNAIYGLDSLINGTLISPYIVSK
jgi:hypothetical protein